MANRSATRLGERSLAIKGKRVAELEADDYQAMRKVIGYVHRHLKQRPAGNVEDSRWRQSLMNWGHDPRKGLTHPRHSPGGALRHARVRR